MFDWMDLVFAFIMGGIVAVWIVVYFVRRWAERLRSLLEQALAEEAGKTTTSISKEEAVASEKIIPLTVEFENNLYYCYNSKTNQFICQGENVDEIISKFKARFPGLNAFFDAGDEAALATLRQQLKNTRESSSAT